jgi:hypothetical protein
LSRGATGSKWHDHEHEYPTNEGDTVKPTSDALTLTPEQIVYRLVRLCQLRLAGLDASASGTDPDAIADVRAGYEAARSYTDRDDYADSDGPTARTLERIGEWLTKHRGGLA